MKGLILSGGKGTRLRPITYTSAKQLVPVANKPVLFYGIEALVGAGIRDIGIVVGDTQAEIRAAVGDGSRWGARVTYIEQDAPRGLAHAVLISEPFIGGDPFVMYLGDNLLNRGIAEFVEEFEREKPAAQILLRRCPTRRCSASPSSTATGRRLVEKPKEPKSDLALVGVYMFGREVFDVGQAHQAELPQRARDHRRHPGPDRPRPRGHGRTSSTGWWKDTGKLEDMLEANRLILDTLERADRRHGRRRVADRRQGRDRGGAVDRALGRARAGDHRRRRAHHPAPTSGRSRRSATDVEIRETEIEHSIVLEGAVITDLANRDRGQPDRPRTSSISPAAGEAVRVPLHARRQLRGGDPMVEVARHRRRRIHRIAISSAGRTPRTPTGASRRSTS